MQHKRHSYKLAHHRHRQIRKLEKRLVGVEWIRSVLCTETLARDSSSLEFRVDCHMGGMCTPIREALALSSSNSNVQLVSIQSAAGGPYSSNHIGNCNMRGNLLLWLKKKKLEESVCQSLFFIYCVSQIAWTSFPNFLRAGMHLTLFLVIFFSVDTCMLSLHKIDASKQCRHVLSSGWHPNHPLCPPSALHPTSLPSQFPFSHPPLILVLFFAIALHYSLIFDVCTLVFLPLMSQAPFCCGLAQVAVGPDDAQWMSHWYTQPNHFNSGQPTYFASKHSQIKCHLIFFFSLLSEGTMTHIVTHLSSLRYPLNIIHLFYLLIFPSLPRISASLSMFNLMDKSSNQFLNCMGLYKKHKLTVSSSQHYHKVHSMQPQAPLWITAVNRSSACLHLNDLRIRSYQKWSCDKRRNNQKEEKKKRRREQTGR
ncbi:hypothetical protein VP01_3396g1 [Puccinia sorghi]|uniref:Uncharacterized protein n=1 Tax=Puccinia sorghi TaxID=27349 RepID=A0A0L6UYK3_9BASI|nr:hypothetical protein VP01_3396g1 [Puccinia sorghi]